MKHFKKVTVKRAQIPSEEEILNVGYELSDGLPLKK